MYIYKLHVYMLHIECIYIYFWRYFFSYLHLKKFLNKTCTFHKCYVQNTNTE